LDEELRFAVIHCHKPECIHWRGLIRWKSKRVVMVAAIERLVIWEPSCHRIQRFPCAVSLNTTPPSCRAQKPVAMIKLAVAESGADTPAISVLTKSRGFLVHVLFPFLHPFDEGNFLFLWQSF